MTLFLLLAGAVIIACVLCNKISNRLGVPMLLAFIVIGMCFGSDGLFKIPFDDYRAADMVCTVALIFIMFYGGFGTKWSEARHTAGKAALLSSLGTILTALLVGLFCHLALGIELLESALIGAVISSTDAASVFSILRSKRLGLKYNTASLLEVESGSNDPFSYMLTVIVLSMMNGSVSGSQVAVMLIKQVALGLLIGTVVAVIAREFMKRFSFSSGGFDAVFIVAVALLSYALPSYVGGNGYLGVYVAGIILGNSDIKNKQSLVHFFDGTTGLMQMLLFFLLGLLSFPSQLPQVALTGLLIALFLTFVARPLVVFGLLSPLRCGVRQMLLVSWAGMRGAASIVFAIMAVINPAVTDNDIFHIVFFIVLFSILLQGSLLPYAARLLRMTDEEGDVMKTFTDYVDEIPIQFIRSVIAAGHPWVGRCVKDIEFPPDSLLVLLIRAGEKLIPNGTTELMEGDTIILSGKATGAIDGVALYEKTVDENSSWAGKAIADIPSGSRLIITIRRQGSVVIPRGDTVLMPGDVLVIGG